MRGASQSRIAALRASTRATARRSFSLTPVPVEYSRGVVVAGDFIALDLVYRGASLRALLITESVYPCIVLVRRFPLQCIRIRHAIVAHRRLRRDISIQQVAADRAPVALGARAVGPRARRDHLE